MVAQNTIKLINRLSKSIDFSRLFGFAGVLAFQALRFERWKLNVLFQ